MCFCGSDDVICWSNGGGISCVGGVVDYGVGVNSVYCLG